MSLANRARVAASLEQQRINQQIETGENISLYDPSALRVEAYAMPGQLTWDAALAACIKDAYAFSSGSHNNRAAVHFGPGIFLFNGASPFTPTSVTSARGIKFTGDGWYTSLIRWGTLGSATWLYDNGATARSQFNTFTDLGFEGADPATIAIQSDVPANAKGFKITSAAWEQGFRFTRCRFFAFDVAFDMEGTNTASEMKFVNCKISHIKTTVYKLNNAQTFNHEFYGCDVEVIWGDIFDISGGNGGGGIKVYGGSWIMFSNIAATDTYFFKMANSTGSGGLPFVFSGIRFELRGVNTNLVLGTDVIQFDALFDGCLIESQGASDKANFCKVGGYETIHFRDCGFYETSTGQMKFQTIGANPRGQAGTITFDSCSLMVDWSDRCTILTTHGHIRAINCRGLNIAGSGGGIHWAHDFDLHWNEATAGLYTGWAASGATLTYDGSFSDCSFRLKTAQLKLTLEYWPTTTEHTLKLPKNAIIKGIHIRKPAGSADATVTVMRVNRNDKTGTAHLDSNSAAYNTALTGDLDNYFYHVGSTVNERTLRLYATVATTGAIQGGICIVEYY